MKKTKEKFDENSIAKISNVINNFCEHLKNGFSPRSFFEMDFTEILELAEKLDNHNRTDTYKQMIEAANRQSRLYWEKLGMNAVIHRNKDNPKSTENVKFNTSVWIFTMRTRFGWKESEPEPESLFPKEMVVRLTTNS